MSRKIRKWYHKKVRRIKIGELPARFTAFFDGCCEPVNPGGTAGYGAMILDGSNRVFEASGLIPAGPGTSNNVAEYRAFIAVLDWLIEHNHHHENVIVHGDSKLVIEQMFGTWRIKAGLYVDLAREAKAKRSLFTKMQGFWIPRDENTICDALSKSHLRKAGVEFRLQPEQPGRD